VSTSISILILFVQLVHLKHLPENLHVYYSLGIMGNLAGKGISVCLRDIKTVGATALKCDFPKTLQDRSICEFPPSHNHSYIAPLLVLPRITSPEQPPTQNPFSRAKGRLRARISRLTSLLTSFFSFTSDFAGDASGAFALTGDDDGEAMMADGLMSIGLREADLEIQRSSRPKGFVFALMDCRSENRSVGDGFRFY
jgi:hypothetical protein